MSSVNGPKSPSLQKRTTGGIKGSPGQFKDPATITASRESQEFVNKESSKKGDSGEKTSSDEYYQGVNLQIETSASARVD